METREWVSEEKLNRKKVQLMKINKKMGIVIAVVALLTTVLLLSGCQIASDYPNTTNYQNTPDNPNAFYNKPPHFLEVGETYNFFISGGTIWRAGEVLEIGKDGWVLIGGEGETSIWINTPQILMIIDNLPPQ